MLASGHVGQAVVSAATLNLQESDLGPDLLLDRIQADQLVKIGLDLIQGPKRGALRQRQVFHASFKAAVGRGGPDGIGGLQQLLLQLVSTWRHTYSVRPRP